MEFPQIFQSIHPISIKLLQNPNKSNLKLYEQSVKEILAKSIPNSQKFVELLIFPLLNTLNKHKLSNEIYEGLFQLLSKIISNLKNIDPANFLNIMNISSIITKQKLEGSLPSEEYSLAYLNLIKTVFENNPKVNDFYDYSNLTSFGLLISLFLDFLSRSDSLQVQLLAIDTLETISQTHKQINFNTGSIFASFLPGISIKIIQNFLLFKDLKLLNHKIIVKCLDYLSFIISNVLNDEQLSKEATFKDFNNNQELKQLIIDRKNDKKWLKNTSEKLNVLLDRLFNALKEHDNYLVRSSLTNLSTNLVYNCFSCLNNYLNGYLEIIVINSILDSNENVLKVAKESLEKIRPRFSSNESSLTRILIKNLEKILYKLPQINDTNNNSQLKLVYSYLALIDDLNEFLLMNFDQIAKMLKCLISMINFDTKKVENFYISSTSIKDVSNLSNFSNDLSEFISFDYQTIRLLCKFFGKSNAVSLIIDYLLKHCDDEFPRKLETMFILSLVLAGLRDNIQISLDEKKSLVKNILDTFVTSYRKPHENSLVATIEAKNRALIEISIIIISIELASDCLKDNFSCYLMDTLSVLLETYMSENLLIKSYSQHALNRLAINLNHNSIENLLSNNYDYLINDLYLNIRKMSLNQSKLDLLCAIISICKSDIVTYLMRVIDEIMLNIEFSENYSKKYYLENICKFIILLGKSMKRWFHNSKCDLALNSSSNKSPKILSFVETIKALQEEILNMKKSMSDFIASDENEEIIDDEVMSEEEEQVEKKPEIHIQIQTKCLELCIHILSNPNKQICYYSLEIIEVISYNLIENNQNDLLPLIHKLWSPICALFKSDMINIKLKIVNLLFHLTKLCGDFLSARFIKELLPKILDFMQKQALISIKHKATNDTTYIYSQAFKLQSIILSDLPYICNNIELSNMDLENLTRVSIIPYLDKHQPVSLQKSAIDALIYLAQSYSDIIWICLHYVVPAIDDYSNRIKLCYSSIQLNDTIRNQLIDLFNNL